MESEWLPIFKTAFLGCKFIRFDYRDAKHQQTRREVEPKAMLILPPPWYLVGWEPMRNGFRHSRVDRITRPEVLPDSDFRRRHVPFANDVCPYSTLKNGLARQPSVAVFG